RPPRRARRSCGPCRGHCRADRRRSRRLARCERQASPVCDSSRRRTRSHLSQRRMTFDRALVRDGLCVFSIMLASGFGSALGMRPLQGAGFAAMIAVGLTAWGWLDRPRGRQVWSSVPIALGLLLFAAVGAVVGTEGGYVGVAKAAIPYAMLLLIAAC